MPKNKNAELRYKELDKCFCNHRKRYTINDLIDTCSDALSEMDSETDKTNHIFEMKLFPNYELETYLLSHADEIQILEPQSLKDKIIERIKNALDQQTK